MDSTLFQYCQKIVIFRNNLSEVLLAKRKGEQDYDGVYSFIGGKLEISDGGILEGLSREKDEELGKEFKIMICPDVSLNVYFVKKSGHHMILPHYFAQYSSGEINLSDEYSQYQWVGINELENFQPKIDTIYSTATRLLELKKAIDTGRYIEI